MKPTFAEIFVLRSGRKEEVGGIVGRIVANRFQSASEVEQTCLLTLVLSAANKISSLSACV